MIRCTCLDNKQLHTQLTGDLGELSILSLVKRVRGIDQYGDPWRLRNEVFENLEQLPGKMLGSQCREPGHIAAGMRQALDETECDGVGHIDENQWNCRGNGVDRCRVLGRRGEDNLWTKRDQLADKLRNPLSLSV